MVSYLSAGSVKESKNVSDREVLLEVVLCKVRILSISPTICSLQKKMLAELKASYATLYFSESLYKNNSIPEAIPIYITHQRGVHHFYH